MQERLLSFLIVVPLLAAAIVLLTPSSSARHYRTTAIGSSLVQILLLVLIISGYNPGAGMQFIEKREWFSLDAGSWGILRADYFLGVDGLSLPLISLAVVIMLIALICSRVSHRSKGYYALILILNAAIIGSFTALDLLLFYLFFEFMLLPMFFLIGIWGGPRREYASMKFFLYTLLGSIFILIVMIGLYLSYHDATAGPGRIVHSFNMLNMYDPANIVSQSIFDPNAPSEVAGLAVRNWGFLLLFLGFAIKLPMVPLHTWLPDAHVEASTPVSVILAALLLKIGGYGFLRIAWPVFPDAATDLASVVAVFGVVSIIYGAMTALGSKDLKRLIAYSSVSHMGFVLIGIASQTNEGVSGAVYQMFSHGILTSMLFIIAGVLYDRTGNRIISDYSGLSSKMPHFFVFVLIAFFASLGLPGFSGFIAEILVLLGAFKSNGVNGLLHESIAILATLGLVLGAAYFLWTIQRMFFGKFHYRDESRAELLVDLLRREVSVLTVLAIAALVFGIFPQPILEWINPFSTQLVDHVLNTARSLASTP